MAGFFLFFDHKGKGTPGKSPAHFEAAGFDATWCATWEPGPVVGKSPSGKPGVVYTPRGASGYFPERQHWEKRKGYWIGWAADKQGQPIPPTPADCLRHTHHGGVPVKLADGREWLIPIAHQLPHEHSYDAAAKSWARKIKEPFREYWEETLKLYTAWVASFTGEDTGSVESTWTQAANFGALALGFNYYLTPALIGEFGLFDDAALRSIQEVAMLKTAILMVEAQKKST